MAKGKKRECDRCAAEKFLFELKYCKGMYFCSECVDADWREPEAFIVAPINPFLAPIPPPGITRGYGNNYAMYYGDGL
jgi:hypothetical protein